VATTTKKRVPPDVLTADRETLLTLQSLPDYTPLVPSCHIAALQAVEAALRQAEEADVMARRALELAHEQLAQAGVVFHEAMLAAKTQVIAQYGEDSPALHAIGRKQKSERRRPARRERAAA
jgi:hypothetical protein